METLGAGSNQEAIEGVREPERKQESLVVRAPRRSHSGPKLTFPPSPEHRQVGDMPEAWDALSCSKGFKTLASP